MLLKNLEQSNSKINAKVSTHNKSLKKTKMNELDELIQKFKKMDAKFEALSKDVSLFERAAQESVIQDSMYEFQQIKRNTEKI